MALPTATLPGLRTLRELRVARATFLTIAAERVSDDAPIEDQHRYWRIHDACKRVYGMLDWQVQKTILRAAMAALLLATISAVIAPPLTPLMGLAALGLGWRSYEVIKRMVPWELDS